MRIALAGKGGAGKTTLAATLSRLLARQGWHVVAIDADSNPNLGAALGLAPDAELAFLPTDLVSRRLDGPALDATVSDVISSWGAVAADDVQLVRMGMPAHADEGCMCAAHATVSALLADLGDTPDTATIVDLEASPEHLSRGTARHVDSLLVVAEPYYRALEAVRRITALAAELPIARVAVIANKLRSAADAQAVREFCERHDLELVGEVPWSDAVLDADAQSAALLDRSPDDPVVQATRELVGALLGRARA